MSRDHQNDSIIKIGQNTKKSPGDLTRLAVTQMSKIIIITWSGRLFQIR